MVSEVPHGPGEWVLSIRAQWNGEAPLRREHHARVALSAERDSLFVNVAMPHQDPPRIPEAPAGTRVDGLWEYDVVECFFVAESGHYVELELGAGGHYLVLSFTGRRRVYETFETESLAIDHRVNDYEWTSSARLPRSWFREPIVRANFFAIGGGAFLAHHPVPGVEPDFHQPATFQAMRIPVWERVKR